MAIDERKRKADIPRMTSSNGNGITAMIWDYDGTLVDSREKNLHVTRRIVKHVAGVDPKQFPALQTLENYMLSNRTSRNWRDLYTKTFGLTEEQTDEAGKLWSEFQLNDTTPTPMFNGLRDALAALQDFPHGIVSQNSRDAIAKTLRQNALLQLFPSIIGYEEVDLRLQKPDPTGLLMCIEKLTRWKQGTVLFVGDHETDMECVFNTNQVLKQRGLGIHVLSIGASYSLDDGSPGWKTKPDYEARLVGVLLEIVQSLQ